ncbi:MULTISPECIES: 30S ribosomal protein S19e [Acidianus]|uniref:Small ribosomal subunit protein eS19 n=1 Tax=Candidatus Acidianus copahuensis TaxID=1160895 RepID=A0A031LPJ0_9CREN|nr:MULTISPECIES: 30S ribosomal protein S19e [Acidianus]EZQ06901.1 30S ribosomal protein S19 [Candidatus Acidianus copahuensis]NON61397.1 30S ribosomal protein S19e [Acidianus sp. RZ1]
MITANMVPTNLLIERLSEYIKQNVKEIQPPEWSLLTKTASYKERLPDNAENWWYTRTASLLSRLYKGSLGVEKAKIEYSGSKRRGSIRPRSVKAPGHSTRLIFHQLEKAGLVTKTKKGRVLSPKGRSMLDTISYEIFKELASHNTSLTKYLG